MCLLEYFVIMGTAIHVGLSEVLLDDCVYIFSTASVVVGVPQPPYVPPSPVVWSGSDGEEELLRARVF